MDVLETHLPKILDLASNFNIDLSGVLSEYAQKLRDDAPELMNGFSFPQAALLLQHCAEIYGRKVDYVFNVACELCDNLNSRLSAPPTSPTDTNQENPITSPKKSSHARKRKNVDLASLTADDFQLLSVPLDKPKVLLKHKKNKKRLCNEGVCVRLTPMNFKNSHEYHIYEEDQLASIGTKDQFRLNWSVENSCRLEEYIRDAGSGSSWNVCDVGVSNMPTPEYSDEGVGEARSDSPPISSSNNEVLPDSIFENEGTPYSDSAVNLEPIQTIEPELPSYDKDQTVIDKPCQKVAAFKLPFELSRKGLKGAKPETNFTLFLFSDLLKRSLQMKGPLPPWSKLRSYDKDLIKKHINFLMERYNLGGREVNNIQSLIEPQEDFFGFEEQTLKDCPEVLSAVEPEEAPNSAGIEISNDLESEDVQNIPSFHDNEIPETVQEANTMNRKTAAADGVADWRQFIHSKLAEESNKNDFDVHAYGSNIVKSFHHVNETVSFAELVGGMDRREVSRNFLSVLMLANASNVTLEDDGPNTLRVTLNDPNIQHGMENVPCPSNVDHPASKRKATSNLEEESETHERGYRKQIPGRGPWKNKSTKRKL